MLKRLFLFSVIAFTFIRCSNDLPINAEWQDIAYVYGVLDPRLDTQFVRIGKTFLGEAPPEQMAAISDSLYYDDIDVDIIEMNEDSVEQNRFRLERIDKPGKLNDNGPFSTEDFHLYYTIEPIRDDHIYRLEISKPDGGPLVTATTDIPNWASQEGNVFTSPRITINLANANREPINDNLDYSRPNNSSVYNVMVYIHYSEQNINDPAQITSKVLSYRTNLTNITTRSVAGSLSGSNFYAVVENNLDNNPNILRYLDFVSLEAVVGGSDMRTYVEVNRPSPGIAQEKPMFTNVENGVGLFTSRNARFATSGGIVNPQIQEFRLHDRSINYLVMELCDKNFVKVGQDSCYCDGGNVVRLGNSTSNCGLL